MIEKLANIEKKNGSVVPDVRIEPTPEALEEELRNHGLLRGLAVVWQMQNVLWGRAEDGRISLSDGGPLTPEYWQELRVFSEDAELHLTRRGGALSGRFRSDAGGDQTVEFIETSSPLWGVRDEEQNGVPDGYVRLRDDGRGLEMIVPCGDVNAEQYGLVTRNYIEADEDTKQAGYTDYRFVRIADAHRKGE